MLSTSYVIESKTVSNGKQLLDTMCKYLVTNAENINVFNQHGNPVTIRLIKDTLTDNSVVYNIDFY